MKKTRKNNKGFTLIELLATIVILGVLMIIAIPMVSKYITSSKQNAFVATAKAYVSAARYQYFNGDFNCGETTNIDAGSGGKIVIPFKYLDVDKTGGNSPFGKKINLNKSCVIIESTDDGKYTYYVRMMDDGNNGMTAAYNEDELKKSHVTINSSNVDGAYDFVNKGSPGVTVGPLPIYVNKASSTLNAVICFKS